MSKVIFRSGLNWSVIEKKWPGFREAFADFSIPKVARLSQRDVDRLMKDPGIVRNRRKIEATVENAREFLAVQREFGSFRDYLKRIAAGSEEDMRKELSRRFSFLGGSTTVFFLRSVGEEMPETMQRWEREWAKGAAAN